MGCWMVFWYVGVVLARPSGLQRVVCTYYACDGGSGGVGGWGVEEGEVGIGVVVVFVMWGG